MKPGHSKFSALITATVFAVALSLLQVPNVFAGQAWAEPGVVSVGAGGAGMVSRDADAVGSGGATASGTGQLASVSSAQVQFDSLRDRLTKIGYAIGYASYQILNAVYSLIPEPAQTPIPEPAQTRIPGSLIPPPGTPPQIEFPLMAGEGFIAVHNFLQILAPEAKRFLDDTVKDSVTIDEAVGILHNFGFLKVGNWSDIVDILKPGNEYSMNEAYTELVRAAVIDRASKINKRLLEELK